MGTAPTPSPHSSYLESLDGYDLSESKENIKPFEPAIRRLKGHTDRCALVDAALGTGTDLAT